MILRWVVLREHRCGEFSQRRRLHCVVARCTGARSLCCGAIHGGVLTLSQEDTLGIVGFGAPVFSFGLWRFRKQFA
jgi:hypothetical protein